MSKENNRKEVKKEKIFDNLFNMAYEPFIVGKKQPKNSKNHFTTVFNALNNLDEHAVIKVNPGLYDERLIIRKCDIKIQSTEIAENCILINHEFPNLTIDLPEPTDKVMLQSLRIANICENNHSHDCRNIDHENLKKNQYQNFKISPSMNTCLYVKRGTVQLDQCKISLAAYHYKEMLVPCIVVEKDGCLILNRSEIRGGMGTIGIVCKGGKVIIKESVISDHGSIGVLACGKKSTNITIKNSTVSRCFEGVVLNGPFEGYIQNTIISECILTGLTLCNGNSSKIFNNQIKQGKNNGVQIRNSIASIVNNIISFNSGWGAQISSTGGMICNCILKFNNISENSKGGILIEGSVNHSQVLTNQIHFNNRFGVKVEKRAAPHIFMNKIQKTLGNGVHVMPHCSVFVQKNEISFSLKCNLVIEGPNNIKNFIYRNKIANARGQGIFVIYGQRFTIKNNTIENNYNGIVSLTGVENIEGNLIKDNEKNGILLIKDNDVSISDNEISGNRKAGLFIRNTSVGRIANNEFTKNKSEIVIENDHASFYTIEKDNKFEAEYDIRVPKNYHCQLI